MPRMTYGPEQIIGMLREADVALGQGRTVGEVSRDLGITSVTYYRWRKEYGAPLPRPLPRAGIPYFLAVRVATAAQ
jgi:putative transposase